MRLAPIPMYFEDDGEQASAMAGESSRVTHGTPMAVDACRFLPPYSLARCAAS